MSEKKEGDYGKVVRRVEWGGENLVMLGKWVKWEIVGVLEVGGYGGEIG